MTNHFFISSAAAEDSSQVRVLLQLVSRCPGRETKTRMEGEVKEKYNKRTHNRRTGVVRRDLFLLLSSVICSNLEHQISGVKVVCSIYFLIQHNNNIYLQLLCFFIWILIDPICSKLLKPCRWVQLLHWVTAGQLWPSGQCPPGTAYLKKKRN